jgi:hypothetical protein
VLLWLQACRCGGCLSGCRSRRWLLAPNPSPRTRRAAIPLRREPPACPTERCPQPGRARCRGKHAPHRPIPPRDMRARPRVPNAHPTGPSVGHDPGKPAARRALNARAANSDQSRHEAPRDDMARQASLPAPSSCPLRGRRPCGQAEPNAAPEPSTAPGGRTDVAPPRACHPTPRAPRPGSTSPSSDRRHRPPSGNRA